MQFPVLLTTDRVLLTINNSLNYIQWANYQKEALILKMLHSGISGNPKLVPVEDFKDQLMPG